MEAWADELASTAGDVFAACETHAIPLLGVVAAGEPYEAFAVEETLNVPTRLWGARQVFALRVRGNSMVDDGIHNGDYIIVEPRQTADNGQTVVAEIDGAVTVKRYHRVADGQVRLQPANPELLPLTVRGDHVRIIGVVVGVLRKFGFGPHPARPAIDRPPPAPRVGPRARAAARPAGDEASLELAVNVLDSQLSRWNAAIAQAKREKRLRRQVASMEELGRELQALRDWCARTRKPGLRRALISEANRLMRRMQRFSTQTPVALPDLVVH